MASRRDARMSLTSPYSIFLACAGVSPNTRPARSSQVPLGSSWSRGIARRINCASATVCILFPGEGERRSLFWTIDSSMLRRMTSADDRSRKTERLGTVLHRVAARLVAMQRIQQGSAAEDRREPRMEKAAADLGAVRTEISGGGAPPLAGGKVGPAAVVVGEGPPARAAKPVGDGPGDTRSAFDGGCADDVEARSQRDTPSAQRLIGSGCYADRRRKIGIEFAAVGGRAAGLPIAAPPLLGGPADSHSAIHTGIR